MSNLSHNSLETLFHPHSIALAGIIISNPEHWTRTFLDSLLKFQFEGPIYLVNRRGGEIKGLKVYQKLEDIPGTVDYVISTVPAQAAPRLIEECAGKGVKAVQFCTAGFSETGEEKGIRLQTELTELARKTGVRIIGPNCMGIYCPESHLSFMPYFPRESGPVGFICQSGGNSLHLVSQAMGRGVRFSKVISFGNACDLNESDFLEYLTDDPATKIIAMYIEGVKEGRRFRQVLSRAAKEKVVILLKGGVTEGGIGATAGHTGALAGSEATWDSLCKQLGVIRVHSLDEMADILVTLLFMPLPRGRKVALFGTGGGASVLITDEFEKRGLKVPSVPEQIRSQILEFTPLAGNILRNPIDYSQTMVDLEKVVRAVGIISQWDGVDFLIWFLYPAWTAHNLKGQTFEMVEGMLEASRAGSKPMAVIVQSGNSPYEVDKALSFIPKCVSVGLPIYYSFAAAANAISLVLSYNERKQARET